MLDYLKGSLVAKTPGRAVVEAGGLGYEVFVPLGVYLNLPDPPAEVRLLLKEVIREESWDLFGFLTDMERETFKALTGVSRIGPRLALTIISALAPDELARALMAKDLRILAGVKGIGVKTAERLLVELKDQAPKLAALAGTASPAATGAAAPAPPPDDEALSALLNLGYSPTEARSALTWAHKEAGDQADLGLVIRLALKALTK